MNRAGCLLTQRERTMKKNGTYIVFGQNYKNAPQKLLMDPICEFSPSVQDLFQKARLAKQRKEQRGIFDQITVDDADTLLKNSILQPTKPPAKIPTLQETMKQYRNQTLLKQMQELGLWNEEQCQCVESFEEQDPSVVSKLFAMDSNVFEDFQGFFTLYTEKLLDELYSHLEEIEFEKPKEEIPEPTSKSKKQKKPRKTKEEVVEKEENEPTVDYLDQATRLSGIIFQFKQKIRDHSKRIQPKATGTKRGDTWMISQD